MASNRRRAKADKALRRLNRAQTTYHYKALIAWLEAQTQWLQPMPDPYDTVSDGNMADYLQRKE